MHNREARDLLNRMTRRAFAAKQTRNRKEYVRLCSLIRAVWPLRFA
ncbi:hypothetical protein KAJ83_01520 [Marivibrio halodurans]|uniref:Uncharacterized protein n=1 Tax=Marivibrio halodurans TaxID=2039722 RepID=A0A8J7V126_9PROT|nr:hypothetical protein [Marivibrio halodurans]MBP5855671.1 hypothetical protein [Marivibrio halodurans]